MKNYIVNATMFTYLQAEIQANSVEKAQAVARELDGSAFVELTEQSSWQTHWDEVREKTIG